jgi:Alw26I/Eco31I/Esp3I family type II restriction endonuclease
MLPAVAARSHGDSRRAWSEQFLRYVYALVENPAYAGMPCTTDVEGKVDWIIPSGRARGSKNWDGNDRRRAWWVAKAEELGIPVEGKWISQTAKRLHPWGWKPCQTCGRWMRITYSYPRPQTLKKLNKHLAAADAFAPEDLLDIFEVTEQLVEILGVDGAAKALNDVFPELKAPSGSSVAALQDIAEQRLVAAESRRLSPGAMSNAPDRLDGFHTYNLCCRSKQDTGRSTDNLKTYLVDRRAFEQWAEGDWEAANVLMHEVGEGPCANCRTVGPLTADHIGPISLGFRHTPRFRALCRSCNSAKNNRMTQSDVDLLLMLEAEGIQVASWQAARIWELLKLRIDSDDAALRLSKLMNVNQHQYLRLLLRVKTSAPDSLLQFLSPQVAEERVAFVGLNRSTLTYKSIERHPRQQKYALSRAARLVRIAFESLDEYSIKVNRNVQTIPSELLAEPDQDVDVAIARAAQDPSSLRGSLVAATDTQTPEPERERLLRELFAVGRYVPERDFGYVRESFTRYMAATGEVLVVLR